MAEPLTILVAARDEEAVIGDTVEALRRGFPDAEVIVADDGSRDKTADFAEDAGAVVLRLPRRGKGQALSAAERAAPPGALLLCDADLSGELSPLLEDGVDLNVAGGGRDPVGSSPLKSGRRYTTYSPLPPLRLPSTSKYPPPTSRSFKASADAINGLTGGFAELTSNAASQVIRTTSVKCKTSSVPLGRRPRGVRGRCGGSPA